MAQIITMEGHEDGLDNNTNPSEELTRDMVLLDLRRTQTRFAGLRQLPSDIYSHLQLLFNKSSKDLPVNLIEVVYDTTQRVIVEDLASVIPNYTEIIDTLSTLNSLEQHLTDDKVESTASQLETVKETFRTYESQVNQMMELHKNTDLRNKILNQLKSQFELEDDEL